VAVCDAAACNILPVAVNPEFTITVTEVLVIAPPKMSRTTTLKVAPSSEELRALVVRIGPDEPGIDIPPENHS
jgi:hypothetical protein